MRMPSAKPNAVGAASAVTWLALTLSATPARAVADLNNRRPKLVPPAGSAWRGSELGAVGHTAADYNAKYKVPLQVWRTFDDTVNQTQTDWVRQGGILWFNFPKGQLGTWRAIANGDHDEQLAKYAAAVASLAPAGVFVCPWHEPDHQIDPQNGMSTDDYREMYWRSQKVFAAHNASNAVWAMDYSSQTAFHTGDNIVPLWPGDDAIDWLFFNVFEKEKFLPKQGEDYVNLTTTIYERLLASSAKGSNFTSKPWGIGAFGSHADVPEAGRARFLRDAKAHMASFPRLAAYLYYDSKDSAITAGAMQSAYEEFISAPAFTANDPGAPPPDAGLVES